ncbi:hypothetical protein C2G38_2165211 [Gigaspora rosea]|uniref:Uncharacterized protein n=1 Tax=Gigaspora rosea TaxID=44941 RepID=A0A397VUU3_9GLOM|nr:hypothetical protein C2G38_2165211 [Gigaspora rosea]
MKNNYYMFFANKLNEVLDLLNEQEFEKIIQNLEQGLEKAIEHYKKWMMLWYHLPLSICNLGGDSSQSFARSFIYVALGNTWLNPLTEQEINYANQLWEDFKVKNCKDFGLYKKITEDINFRGLFMTPEFKESRLRFSSWTIDKENFNNSLKEI